MSQNPVTVDEIMRLVNGLAFVHTERQKHQYAELKELLAILIADRDRLEKERDEARSKSTQAQTEATYFEMRDLYHAEKTYNAKLQAEVLRLREIIVGLHKMDLVHPPAHRSGDWACIECHPESELLKAGFQCAYHQACAEVNKESCIVRSV